MDEHPPVGFGCTKLGLPPFIFHPTPSPYGIPYGVLVARDIENLMFAGRCASCTHMAMSSTRVMGTATVMGQAAGTAAAMAIKKSINPPDVSAHIDQLQQQLIRDDAYLPGVPQKFSQATMKAKLAASSGDPEPLRDGINRPVGNDEHACLKMCKQAWHCRVGDTLEMHMDEPVNIRELTIIADSSLDRLIQMSHFGNYGELTDPPGALLKDASVEILVDGKWIPASQVRDNFQRLVRIPIHNKADAIRLTIEETWGEEQTRLFAAYIDTDDVSDF